MPEATPQELVDEVARFVSDRRVLEALRDIPREVFVPEHLRDSAWENRPLPIGSGQTISQPLVVARMCELLELRGGETVLDVGTGSGYHAAVLARLSARVVSIERHIPLATRARRALAAAGVGNVELLVGDGTDGFAPRAPYDAINVAAAGGPDVPAALLAQLADGGRLVIPMDDGRQRLVRVRRRADEMHREEFEEVAFVPLVSDAEEAAARSILDLVE